MFLMRKAPGNRGTKLLVELGADLSGTIGKMG